MWQTSGASSVEISTPLARHMISTEEIIAEFAERNLYLEKIFLRSLRTLR